MSTWNANFRHLGPQPKLWHLITAYTDCKAHCTVFFNNQLDCSISAVLTFSRYRQSAMGHVYVFILIYYHLFRRKIRGQFRILHLPNCTWMPSFNSGHFLVSEQLCDKELHCHPQNQPQTNYVTWCNENCSLHWGITQSNFVQRMVWCVYSVQNSLKLNQKNNNLEL